MIKVNKEVAERLRQAEINEKDSIVFNVYKLLRDLRPDLSKNNMLMQDWFNKNNVTISDLEKAFTEGYEEIYEFKVGDILKSQHGNVFIISETGRLDLESVNKYMREGYTYKLVCKAEDRLDLKEGK